VAGVDSEEYLEVELFEGDSWHTAFFWTDNDGDDNQWHHETFDLSDYLGASDFSIRLSTLTSSLLEHVHIDDLRVVGVREVECTVDEDCLDGRVCVDNACDLAIFDLADMGYDAVGEGGAQFLLVMNPTRMEQVRTCTAAGEKMPQKSTDFYPKVISGLVISPVGVEERL